MPEVTTPEELQLAAAEIASLVHKDPAFAKALKEAPTDTLRDYQIGGKWDYRLGDVAIRELMSQDPWLEEQVRNTGGLDLLGPAADVECICTGCCITCMCSAHSTPPDVSVFGAPIEGVEVEPERENLLNNLV